MQSQRNLLESLSFGSRVAEDELDSLESYFVETDQWQKLISGRVDIVFGPKGSGKSALYFLIQRKRAELLRQGIHLVVAENPREAPAFRALVMEPPTTESEFVFLWKLYIIAIILANLPQQARKTRKIAELLAKFREAGLLKPGWSLREILTSVQRYVRRFQSAALETTLHLDPTTGQAIGIGGRISLAEPTPEQVAAGVVSADSVARVLNDALAAQGSSVWVLIDRLDVAFAENERLEANALRALFKAYLDFLRLEQIELKIFLRSDIWRRITEGGFREASHITRQIELRWNPSSLLNLVVRRVLANPEVSRALQLQPKAVLKDVAAQAETFRAIFPDQVDPGSRKPKTFDWMLGHTKDGTGTNAPRELIHLLTAARDLQLQKLEIGEREPPEGRLFTGSTIKEALGEVSRARLEQTLYAEYPQQRDYIEWLRGHKAEQHIESLCSIWEVDPETGARIAQKLVEIGFFEKSSAGNLNTYKVPFIYRAALDLVQGRAQ